MVRVAIHIVYCERVHKEGLAGGTTWCVYVGTAGRKLGARRRHARVVVLDLRTLALPLVATENPSG